MTATPSITKELAQALGLPKHTRKAVLTLEVGELPTLEIETFVIADAQPDMKAADPDRIKQVSFMVRLMPFRDSK